MLNLIEVDKQIKTKPADLLTLPNIVYVRGFNEENARKFCLDFAVAHDSGQSVIPLVIDSYGGDVYALLTMIDIVRASKVPVATIVEGKAMSCGAVMTTFGAEGMRFAAPNATIMIHEVSDVAWGKNEEVKASTAECDRLNTLVFNMMAENCGKPKDYFLKLVHEKNHADWFLTAPEAKLHNVINHVRIPSFKTRVKVETTFE